MLHLLAQSSEEINSALDSALLVVNLGLAGVGLLAFVKGWIVSGRSYNEAVEKEREAVEKLDELNTAINDKFMPEIQRARSVQVALGQLIDRVVEFIETQDDETA